MAVMVEAVAQNNPDLCVRSSTQSCFEVSHQQKQTKKTCDITVYSFSQCVERNGCNVYASKQVFKQSHDNPFCHGR
jgi:hypothetical protein